MTRRYDLAHHEYEAAFRAFEEAVAKAPGQVALANICRCTQGNISQLISARSLLPGRHVLKVEAATGIPRERLRPDIYPPEHPSQHSLRGDVSSVASGGSVVACDRTALLQRKVA